MTTYLLMFAMLIASDAQVPCRQVKAEQSSLIQKAQNRKYSLRRLELIGNEHINDLKLRKRILLREGDIFSRSVLIRSLTNVSKLRAIYPVTLKDVVVQLKDEEKTIDLTICVKEKPLASVADEPWTGTLILAPLTNELARLSFRVVEAHGDDLLE
jgi:hypothetical protein